MYSDFDISIAKWGLVKDNVPYDLAVLPWGATEPHNYHLPYCTDVLISKAIGLEAAGIAAGKGVKAMVLPGIPLGAQNPGQGALPFCIHTRMSTQAAILEDIVVSLERQRICKLLIVNGHGGNTFKGMVRDLMIDHPERMVCICDWFAFVPPAPYFSQNVDDHAGEMETSVMLHYYPDLVRMDLAGDGASAPFDIDGLNRKVGWIPRDWSKVTKDTGVGYPKASSAEKGRDYMQAVVPQVAQLICDLATKNPYKEV